MARSDGTELARAHRWRATRVDSPAAAAALVKPGDSVFIGGGCAVPVSVLEALEDRAFEIPGARILHYMTRTPAGSARSGALRHRALYVGEDVVALARRGRLDYVPMTVSEVPGLIRRNRVAFDVTIIQVSPPDASGMCSLGVTTDLTYIAAKRARLTIAEINHQMPRTRGRTTIHMDMFDAWVEVDRPLPVYDLPPHGEDVEQIGRYVARLIDDGATLHIGVTPIPNEVLLHLDNRTDLGIHSDVITDAVVDLVERGIVTGRRKSVHRGKITTSAAMGTERLFTHVDRNPTYQFLPIEQVADWDTIRQQERMVSITEGSLIDLTGQVCCERRDGEPRAGIGTVPQFHAGAAAAPDGRAVVCLRSLDQRGVSSVRAMLGPHEAVTIPRYAVHWVVTEYGMVFLQGMSEAERAVALIEIAHPEHRDRLLHEAIALGIVPPDQTLRSRTRYPVEEERTLTLKDGTVVRVRPTKTSDTRLIQELFFRLRPEDVRTRFFRNLSSLTRQAAEHLCSVGYEREMAFAVVVGDAEDERIVATSSYFVDPQTAVADVAYMIDPAWQGRGLGTLLHARTCEYAREHGVHGLSADVLEENTAMLRILRRGPGRTTLRDTPGGYEVEVLLIDAGKDDDEPPLASLRGVRG